MLASAAMTATSSRTAKHCMENNHLQQQDTNSEGQYVGSETRSKTLELPVIPPQSLKLKHGQDERKTEEQILSLREELLRGNVEQFVQRSFEVLTNSVPAKGMLLEIYRDLHLIYQFAGRHDEAYSLYAACKKLHGSRFWAPALERKIFEVLNSRFPEYLSEANQEPATCKAYYCIPHKPKVDGGLIDVVREFQKQFPTITFANLFYKMTFEREFTDLVFTLKVSGSQQFWDMKDTIHGLLLQRGYLPGKDMKSN